MNLKLIRLVGHHASPATRLTILFALPVLLTILASFLKWADLVDLLPDMTLRNKYLHDPAAGLSLLSSPFVISILVVGATFSYLDSIPRLNTEHAS